MDRTAELTALIEAAQAAAHKRASESGMYAGGATAAIAGHLVGCRIEPNSRNGRGANGVVQKGWYLDGKRSSIANVMAAIGGAA